MNRDAPSFFDTVFVESDCQHNDYEEPSRDKWITCANQRAKSELFNTSFLLIAIVVVMLLIYYNFDNANWAMWVAVGGSLLFIYNLAYVLVTTKRKAEWQWDNMVIELKRRGYKGKEEKDTNGKTVRIDLNDPSLERVRDNMLKERQVSSSEKMASSSNAQANNMKYMAAANAFGPALESILDLYSKNEKK